MNKKAVVSASANTRRHSEARSSLIQGEDAEDHEVPDGRGRWFSNMSITGNRLKDLQGEKEGGEGQKG